jgi:hypothetical protein
LAKAFCGRLSEGGITIAGEAAFRNKIGSTRNLVGPDSFTGAINFDVSD